MNYIERYFDKPVFAGFALLLPSTFVLLSIFMSAAGSDFMISEISDIKRTLNLFTAAYFTSLISVSVCFADIIKINSRQTEISNEIDFIYRKSFVNISIISINAIYVFLIFMYRELEKFGNIPVGRN